MPYVYTAFKPTTFEHADCLARVRPDDKAIVVANAAVILVTVHAEVHAIITGTAGDYCIGSRTLGGAHGSNTSSPLPP